MSQTWLSAFQNALSTSDQKALEQLFLPDAGWRDYLAYGWDLRTHEGLAEIQSAAQHATSFKATSEVDEHGLFNFETDQARGVGHVSLVDGRAESLFTQIDELKGHEEPRAARRPYTWPKDEQPSDPYVLIVGGGQAGLALGARLKMMGVPYLIVDKYPRVGDQWRNRYKTLTLHDPIWYDHLPYQPFPDYWPVFTPKDKMADWLDSYARALEINVWNSTEFSQGSYDEASQSWSVEIKRDGQVQTLKPKHLVMAVGTSGFPRVPEFEGQDQFAGQQMHSSKFRTAEGLEGKNVLVVGGNNSAHDIAEMVVNAGGKPTLVQRSSTLVVKQMTYLEEVLAPIFSQGALDRGITTDKADILQSATPMRLFEKKSVPQWDRIQERDADFYDRLRAAGFTLDFAEDGTGLGAKYRRAASGYYIDVGASEMVIDGRIGVRSGVTIDKLGASEAVLTSGETMPADMIVYATGYGTMEDWVSRLISPEVAEKVGHCWGYGSGFKGDPGPWQGELRNMWKPTAQDGLWFMGGNLYQCRYFSKILALQLKARFAGLA